MCILFCKTFGCCFSPVVIIQFISLTLQLLLVQNVYICSGASVLKYAMMVHRSGSINSDFFFAFIHSPYGVSMGVGGYTL